ncbi:MAG: LacI family transcriptional regulator [Acidobacteriia bacterium]|nr:LacI family transcriptional regulator [Terriglobia bacterium]
MRQHQRKKRATIVDVAAKAAVSLGTASRVMNNRRDVDPELRRRVTEAARTLSYVRAERGRRPSHETCPIISFVLSNREFLHPMHARMLQGAEQYCEEHGYFVVFKRLDYTAETPVLELKLPALLREHGIADCLILAGTNYPNLIEATEAAGVPYVLYGNNLVGTAPHRGVDQARSDDRTGAVEAVRYLVRLGHKRICFIGDISQPWFSSRHQAYLAVIAEAGLEPIAQVVGLAPDSFQNGFTSTEAILRRGLRPTAIFAASDHIALGVWEQLRRSGLRVPEDCSLIGFDDIPDSRLTNPPLTTVHNPFLELGRELARLAIEKTRTPCAAIPEVLLPTEFMMRGTTWPCLEACQVG